MNENWVEIRKSGDYLKIGQELGISPVTARILRNRGIETSHDMKAFMSGEGIHHDADELHSMNVLVRVMTEKIREGRKIRIIGDYDVDGICSTYILFRGLTYLGADCDYTIPHRIEDGYGINIRLIDDAHAAWVDTIITCDNGIAAKEQTLHAGELGMTMVITDHHEVPYEELDGEKRWILPDADAIVDPKLPQDTYPFKGICGAVVAYKVIEALACAGGAEGTSEYKDMMLELSEFAALATVCDVCELTDENRTIVKNGLKLMNHSRNRGLKALIEETGLSDKVLSVYHLGFVIGPCLNASGRLDTSLKALELFTESDPEKIRELATELKELNESRKAMTIKETEKAIDMVLSKDRIDDVIVLLLDDCHESLAGIIAGRVRERFSHPAFVFTPTENGLKGSGRSIEAYHMFEGLTGVKELLSKFGGHKLAAGVSLPRENFEEFKVRINENSALTADDFKETLRIDMELPFAYADLNLARELEKLEPFGTGFEAPLFARRGVTFLSGRIFGKNANVASYKVLDADGKVYEIKYFGDFTELEDHVAGIYGEDKKALLHSGQSVNIKLDICYRLSVNSYKGTDSASLVMKCYR